MWIETTLALRFLREGRAQTVLILVGIAVGVAVIVFISALIAGLQSNIIERTLGTQAHIRVEAPDERNAVLPLPDGATQLVAGSAARAAPAFHQQLAARCWPRSTACRT